MFTSAQTIADPALVQRILDQMPDGVILLDQAGLAASMNKAALALAGAGREELLGKPLAEVLAGYENVCHLPGCGQDGQVAPDMTPGVETVLTRLEPGGFTRYYQVNANPIRDDAGRQTHTLVMVRDITNRTSMERRLQQAEKLAAIGELSTYVAHEIRNPLFAIAGFANSLLRSQDMGDKAREKVGIILEESNRLDKILKSLFNFARPTQGAAGRADTAEMARQTVELLGVALRNQGVDVRLHIAPDLPQASGDAELLKQCLINLVKNAMEAMPQGGTLSLRCLRRQDRVIVEVEDTGPGIPPDILNQVFNPFFSTKDKGAGLGLAMTKKILDELGGAVELENRPGKGVVVRMVLPPATAEDPAAGEPKTAPRHDSRWIAGA